MINSNQITNQSVEFLPINSIVPFILGNSRLTQNGESRKLLRESIRSEGVLSPITVRPSAKDGVYEVVAGFGRWQESKTLGLDSIPALIKEMDDGQAYEAQLAENLVRQDLTLVDEAKAAQKFVSLYEGDHTAAANRLGWNPNKLKERLNLLRCSGKVLEALNTNTIKIAHAVILSSFSTTLQDGTLEKIIKEKWTVQTLKERAGRAKKYLHTAKFGTSNCASCVHNTVRQMGMFNTEQDSQAQCAKLTCWNEKTTQWLVTTRAQAEEKYGKVLLFIESDKSDRNTVSPALVGAKQFNACTGCESRVAIMDDRYGKEGNITESQCLDKVCFAKCTQALTEAKKASTEKAAKSTQAPTKSTTGKSTTATKQSISKCDSKATEQVVIQKTPASVTERERDALRTASFAAVGNEAWLKQGIVLASLADSTGYKSPLFKKAHNFNERVLACAACSIEDLQKEIMASVEYLASSHTSDSYQTKNPIDLMIGALALSKNASDVATSAWNADKDTLKNYTVQGMLGLCQQAKFDVAFDVNSDNQEKKITFAKIAKKSKPDLIKAITGFKFDWSGFAPHTMLAHLKK